jgi:hypothetical protein
MSRPDAVILPRPLGSVSRPGGDRPGRDCPDAGVTPRRLTDVAGRLDGGQQCPERDAGLHRAGSERDCLMPKRERHSRPNQPVRAVANRGPLPVRRTVLLPVAATILAARTVGDGEPSRAGCRSCGRFGRDLPRRNRAGDCALCSAKAIMPKRKPAPKPKPCGSSSKNDSTTGRPGSPITLRRHSVVTRRARRLTDCGGIIWNSRKPK